MNEDTDKQDSLVAEASPMEHVTADDPPNASTGTLVQYAYFGTVLHERLDELGISNTYRPIVDPRKNGSPVIIDWLKVHLIDTQSSSQ